MYQLDDEALLRLVYDKNETKQARQMGIDRLVSSKDTNIQTKLRLLEMAQTMAQAELEEAQGLGTTASNRKDRKPGVCINDVLIRGAKCQLQRIQKEILELQS